MKVFWCSNAPFVGSGYGQTTARFTPRIRDLGHDVAMFCNYGLKGTQMQWEGMNLYPGGADGWGNDVVTAYALHHFTDGGTNPEGRNAGWVIFLQDIWTIKSDSIRELHCVGYAPVDHVTCPPMVAEFFTRTGAVPWAMSKHGFQAFQQAGLNPMYVPHGIDTNMFKPMPEVRDEARDFLHIPKDAHVFGMFAANQATSEIHRKGFSWAFRAFKKVHDKHPDTFLYLHTMKGNMYGGADLTRMAEACELKPDSYAFVDQFAYTFGEINTDMMPGYYAAVDTLLNPAVGEGFGMPIIEAQSCGVPVILADNTAMHDLCGGGWLVKSEPVWDEVQAAFWGGITMVDDLAWAMEKAYRDTNDKLRKKARQFVVDEYDADTIMATHWKPALDQLETMLHAPEAKPVDVSALKL